MATLSLAGALSAYMRGRATTGRAAAHVCGPPPLPAPPLEDTARAAVGARPEGRGARGGRRGASCGRPLEVGEAAPVPKRRRLSYDAAARDALGQQALAFRQEFEAEHGHTRGVWLAFQELLA